MRVIRFLSSSALIHVLAIAALGLHGSFEHGLATQNISPNDAPVVPVIIAIAGNPESRPPFEETVQAGKGAQTDGMRKPRDYPPAGKTDATPVSSGSMKEEARIPDKRTELQRDADRKLPYYPVGRLTRLPVPLAPVDLNVYPFTSRTDAGSIEITLFIDANGSVSDMVIPNRNENAREFSDLVASRFRNVHFSPGEINGRKVGSRVTITVVSEPV